MTREPTPVKGDFGMLGQYGLGSSNNYGQRRAPMGFGGGGRLGQPMSYGAYTPPQGLGQQTQYSSYTPPQSSSFGSQPTGTSRAGILNGETEGTTLGNGQYYHYQPQNAYVSPMGSASGLGNVTRTDASRLNQASNSFMKMERMPGYGASNIPGARVNPLTGLAEQIPGWTGQPAAQAAPVSDNGLGGMTWNPASNSWGYAGLNNPDSLRGTTVGDTGLSYGPSASLTPTSVWGQVNGGLPTGVNWMANNPYGAVNRPGWVPGANP